MSLAILQQRMAALCDLLCTINMLVWDSRTMMPAGGAETRGHQIATITGIAREMLLSNATRDALAAAEEETRHLPEGGDERMMLAQVRRGIEFHSRIPAELVDRRARVRPLANTAWVEARRTNDFALFAPWLQDTVESNRELAAAIGYEKHPYDALLMLFEPGETVESLDRLFAALRAGITPVLDKAAARPRPPRGVVRRTFPQVQQKAAAEHFSAKFGYDYGRGRLDTTVHPFEIAFTRNDVRITTRYYENYLPAALFGAFHETGHGLYEQNIDPALTRTPLGFDLIGMSAMGGTSLGAHESQSRLWENHVGRNRNFWRTNFTALQGFFPDLLDDVTPDEFYAEVTTVRPGPIRVEADELSYDFHILLRTEFEAALVKGDLAPRDVPGAWRERMKSLLGVEVQSDTEGCLQDVHWSSGMLGSFCSYTIGNVMAAQLFEVAARDGAVADRLAKGEYAALTEWLRKAVWQHGHRKTRDEILVEATGRPLETGPYIAYLSQKYA